jgi:hypothetical protein
VPAKMLCFKRSGKGVTTCVGARSIPEELREGRRMLGDDMFIE